MLSSAQHAGIADCDDFTYTEDPAGERVRVPVSKEYVFKVVVLGDYSVGKTSLIKRLLSIADASLSLGHNGDDSDMGDSDDDSDAEVVLEAVTPTIGTDFYALTVPHAVLGASVRLQIWDTAGLEKYAANYQSTLRNASFIICVFDVTSASSLHSVVDRHLSIAAEHLPELDQSSIMVVANKIDIVADASSNARAFCNARKRALRPASAFVDANDAATATGTDDGSADIFTSADGLEEDDIVTARKVQAEVFELFTDVHYAEVSAKTKQHLKELLQEVCNALLRNSTDSDLRAQIPAGTPPKEMLARTLLPPHAGASIFTAPRVPALSASTEPQADSATSTMPAAAAAVTRDAPHTDCLQPSPCKAAPPPAGSWRSTGAFSFDLAPTHSSSTAVFSPLEVSNGDMRRRDDDVSPPSDVVSIADSPVNRPSTEMPTPRASVKKSADAGGGKQRRREPDPTEDPMARKLREQAEMKELLEGARRRSASSSRGLAATGGSDVRPLSSAETTKTGMDRTLGGPRDASTASQPGAMTTSLDLLGMQDECKVKRGSAGRDSDDEDGVRMQAQLKERFAQIERDIREDGAMAKLRARKTKVKGKCHCCVV
ncbi:hypothetical protein LSCM1_01384 [Leishmania martiniquensis]|uniref:Ras-like small GTPases n=1 Tax=Leishmania martiniquensis TaxID=1580590 RepID=A0A836KFZ3_9TRYP|nr:hypothetical protein LSCM1_01384 [Leishmania martiniquensis]